MRKLTFYHCYSCHLQEIKAQVQKKVQMNGDGTISPTSSEKNVPLRWSPQGLQTILKPHITAEYYLKLWNQLYRKCLFVILFEIEESNNLHYFFRNASVTVSRRVVFPAITEPQTFNPLLKVWVLGIVGKANHKDAITELFLKKKRRIDDDCKLGSVAIPVIQVIWRLKF